MANPVVVDSDLLIDFLRGRGTGVDVVTSLIAQRRLRVTVITAFELRVGTDFLSRQADILQLLRGRTIPLDMAAAIRAGAVAAELSRQGRPIGFADCLQAGLCLRHGLRLATRSRKHFDRIDGLEIFESDRP